MLGSEVHVAAPWGCAPRVGPIQERSRSGSWLNGTSICAALRQIQWRDRAGFSPASGLRSAGNLFCLGSLADGFASEGKHNGRVGDYQAECWVGASGFEAAF